jgi:excisionase family DNA binding protein
MSKECEVMTTEEVSKFLQVSEQVVKDMARRGKLRGLKVGGVWRFHRQAIRSLLHAPDAINLLSAKQRAVSK